MDDTARLEDQPIQASGSYRAWKLNSRIPLVVDLAWRSRSDHVRPETHRLLPFTEPSLALRRRFSADGATLDWDFVIFRARPDGGVYDPAPGEELFALRLVPEAMESGLRMRATDHLDKDCEVPKPLLAALDDAASHADREDFEAAWRSMLEALCGLALGIEVDRIGAALNLARRSGGMLAPSELADHAGLSARHMRRGFVDRLGLSPRAMLRRQRLTAAMLVSERLERPAWADIAAAHNFSDQAHMVRESRALTGQSPGEWHRHRRSMAVSFNT